MRPGFFMNNSIMRVSVGVSFTGAPSASRLWASKSYSSRPTRRTEPPAPAPPSSRYRRRWLFTRATSSMALKGLVM